MNPLVVLCSLASVGFVSGADPQHQLAIERIHRTAHEATVSLRVHADVTRKTMDRLLAESSRGVRQLEQEDARTASAMSGDSEAAHRQPALAGARAE